MRHAESPMKTVVFLALLGLGSLLMASCGANSSTSSQQLASLSALGSGKVSFKVTPGKSTSVSYDPGLGYPTSASVTDPSGYRWTITIPPGATPLPATVTLTPITLVSEPTGYSIVSGVEVSPSGLLFNNLVDLYSVAPIGQGSIVQYYFVDSSTDTIHLAPMTSAGVVEIPQDTLIVGATKAPSTQSVRATLAKAISTIYSNLKLSTPNQNSIPAVSYSCYVTPQPPSLLNEAYISDGQQPERSEIIDLAGMINTALLTGAESSSSIDLQAGSRDIGKALSQIADSIEAQIQSHWHDPSAYWALSQESLNLDSLAKLTSSPFPQSNTATEPSPIVVKVLRLVMRWDKFLRKTHCKG